MPYGDSRRRGTSNKTFGEGILVLVVLGAFAIIVDSHVTGVNYCAGGDTALLTDTSSLARLPVNQTSSSSIGQELSNATFWRLALTTAAHSASTIVQSTVAGLISSDQHWKNWTEQNLSDPPPWLSTSASVYVQNELSLFGQNATALDNVTAVQGMIKQLVVTESAAGLTLLDYLSFNGITGLETYFNTQSSSQAVCATFSGQLAQLYMLSFDPKVPSDQRAEYLGQLLAITAVMAALQGTSHFGDQFKTALGKAGLSDAWPSIKPYLSSLSNKISAKASMLAFLAVEKVAQRFPQNSAWTAGLTIDRIQSLADVMKQEGASDVQIESQISNLVQAAGDATGPEDVADAADYASFEQFGRLEVKLGSENQMYLYSQAGTMQFVKTDFLQKVVPGFKAGTPCQLKVYYFNDQESLYHQYTGGKIWMATVPSDLGNPGDLLTIYVSVLTEEEFVKSIPGFTLTNDVHFGWLPASSNIEGFTLNGDALTISATQTPSVEGISSFTVQAKATTFGFVPGVRSYLQFGITDYFGNSRTMRVYYDGHTTPTLGLAADPRFPKASFLAYDGIRLRIAYNYQTINVATIYMADPSVLYRLGVMVKGGLWFPISGASEVFTISKVDVLRQTENSILTSMQSYPVGRVGAEIAYTVATQKLGLSDVVLQDPALGGPDLFTKDGKVVLEARMLSSTSGANSAQLQEVIGPQLNQMIDRLNSDFKVVTTAGTGYAILSYLDTYGQVQTIVIEVVKA